MANTIKHKRGSGSDPAANNLVLGELAIRTDNGKLFTKMDSGAIAEIAGGGSDIAINTLSSSSATGGGSATFNGSAYRFTLSSPPSVSAAQLLVSVNGVIQKPVAGTGQPSEGFSVSGNDIIFGDAPATGADFFILTFRSLGVSEPADNSVTSAKIVDGAIVNADINASAAIAGTKISPDFGSQNIVTTGSLGSGDITITGTNPEIFFTDSNNNSDFRIKLESGIFAIQDTTNSNANRLAIDSSGLVGIGTTSPAAPFHVYNATNNTVARLESGDATARLHLKDNSGETFVEATGDNLIFSNTSSTTERMRINSVGAVMVGGTLQASTNGGLNVEVTDSGNERVPLSLINQGTANGSGVIISHRGKDDAGNQQDYNYIRMVADDTSSGSEDGSIRFWTLGSGTLGERLRIDSSGKVIVKTGHLNLENATATNSRHFSITNAAGTTGWTFGNGVTASSHQFVIYDNTVGAARMLIDSSGNLGIGTTSPSTKLHVNGTVTATAYAGDGSNLTGISAGATGGGSDEIFYENSQAVTTDYTITSGKNAMSAGPITINNGVSVTVPSGSTYTIV